MGVVLTIIKMGVVTCSAVDYRGFHVVSYLMMAKKLNEISN